MPARNSIKIYADNSYYHIYNRGVEKRLIFLDSQDYGVFLSYLKEYLTLKNEKELNERLSNPNTSYKEKDKILKLLRMNNFYGEITLLAYCLMPNHFHLILKESSGHSISELMLSLQTSYSKAINKRTHRVGHLFQGTFKDKCIGKTEYLVHLSRYIHLNPTLAGLVDLPEDWEFSSYRDYIGLRQGTLVEKETILSEFDDAGSYRKFVMDYQDALNIQDLILEED